MKNKIADLLLILDDLRNSDKIEYDTYSNLYDKISEILPKNKTIFTAEGVLEAKYSKSSCICCPNGIHRFTTSVTWNFSNEVPNHLSDLSHVMSSVLNSLPNESRVKITVEEVLQDNENV